MSKDNWKRAGLSHAQVGMLYLLAHHTESSVKEAADFLGITKSAVTQLADPLDAKGLIARRPDPADRRIVRLSLTPQGRQLLKKLAQHKFDALRAAIGSLDDKEVEALCGLLKKALGNMSAADKTAVKGTEA
jgi:DNA-binding MarR family transcriptional regulator